MYQDNVISFKSTTVSSTVGMCSYIIYKTRTYLLGGGIPRTYSRLIVTNKLSVTLAQTRKIALHSYFEDRADT